MPFYVASGRRDTTPEQEIDYLKTLVEPAGAKALKFRVGGRMSRNEDAMPGRTDKLIPLVRKVFGDKMVIHADANSSYDPPKAIEVGTMLEDVGAIHYEEPCPFDNFDDTKKVTDALEIPSRVRRTGIQPLAFPMVHSQSRRGYRAAGSLLLRRDDSFAPRGAHGRAWPTWRPPCISPADLDLSIHCTSPPARRRSARGRNTKRAWRLTANGSIRR